MDKTRTIGQKWPIQTNAVVKMIFSYSGRLKTLRFHENLKSHFLHKTNTFSYNENVKNSMKSHTIPCNVCNFIKCKSSVIFTIVPNLVYIYLFFA